ncbi:TRAP-type mannitol/chloroaromatic compound transport system permease small subunit [Dongia mobilis]|uniref:TRAP transporter small permease protein n=1 Tax=Dongia mobilis TaxID=578943 RepID=A0A4R6WU91_9PROT|nr:TRAP-type mannitol/chloroaromatic compound transport system permease small subunit [Dongia mobilis]
MRTFLGWIDLLSIWSGRLCAWSIIVLTLMISWEVFSRYVLGTPHAWVFDAQAMLYGLLFMMAGAYTLAQGGHVRGDVLYTFFRPRVQASIDLILYIFFFVPGVVALAWAGWIFAAESWAINEHSSISADGPPIYPFKTVIPIAGGLLLLQGFVEMARCVACLRLGKWPPRAGDVAEVDVEKLKEMVHVSDADIAALDRYVTGAETGEDRGARSR